ncbi:hypothetical protein N0V82_009991 [Gnomoniopsis sp. IMI 355080]|nr:hypothetical protein N0V82_009991 [Gnomoniopsis sp. IMI 355080]
MADISSIINTPNTPAAGQAEGTVTPIAAENNQTVEQDSALALAGQNDQPKATSTSEHIISEPCISEASSLPQLCLHNIQACQPAVFLDNSGMTEAPKSLA